jgi:SRSO17 transposase
LQNVPRIDRKIATVGAIFIKCGRAMQVRSRYVRPSGEKKYYLANLPAKTSMRTLAAIIKARWICEQAHQQLKEELGLDHFEGRS